MCGANETVNADEDRKEVEIGEKMLRERVISSFNIRGFFGRKVGKLQLPFLVYSTQAQPPSLS